MWPDWRAFPTAREGQLGCRDESVAWWHAIAERSSITVVSRRCGLYAIEFEADIRDGVVKIPEQYQLLKNGHARIVVLYDTSSVANNAIEQPVEIDFSQVKAPSFAQREGGEYQRSLRDEW